MSYRKFLSNRIGASKLDILDEFWQGDSALIQMLRARWRYFVNACAFTEPCFTDLIIKVI